MTDTAAPVMYHDTLAPDAISDELRPTIDELGLEKNCRELAENGWTVVEDLDDGDVNNRLRDAILDAAGVTDDTGGGGGNMLLAKDPVFAEAVLNPKLMALAEFSVGRGFLLLQLAGSVKPQGTPGIGLHADQNWFPAPFPDHNMIMTACWSTDGYSKEGGSTLVIPGSHLLKRHPTPDEAAAKDGAIAIECPPNSAAVWDGSIWHASWDRTLPGQRVVAHISYNRLALRPCEDYSQWADDLIDQHGPAMAQLLGRNDSLYKPTGFDYTKLADTFNNAKR